MTTGIEIIAAERQRQIDHEGWTIENDRKHLLDDSLALAAACYALPSRRRYHRQTTQVWIPIFWPWSAKWWKPTPDDRIRELAKAGALIAAEIDRLQGIQRKRTSWPTNAQNAD